MSETTYRDVEQYYNNEYYADLENGRPNWHFSAYLNILQIRRSDIGKAIADIGCGTCHLLSHANKRGLKCSGIDISEKAIVHAKRRFPFFDLHVGKAEVLPWEDEQFDFVTCLGALEHFLDQHRALGEMRRVSKRDGTFLIMVPNSEFPDWRGTDQQQIKETLMSLGEWQSFFEKSGFRVMKVLPDRWPVRWIPLRKRNPIRLLRGLIERYRIWSLPLDKSYQFIFVMKRIR